MQQEDKSCIQRVSGDNMITIQQTGDFHKLDNFLERCKDLFNVSILDKYGTMGCQALASVTPSDTGKTADSWYYVIKRTKDTITLTFCNSNSTPEGTPIAILLQYGHATNNGGFVQGVDFINPVIVPIFEEIAECAWREVVG